MPIPCPFCGSKDLKFEYFMGDEENSRRVSCKGCGYSPDWWNDTNDDAATYWNTRPIEDALQAQIDALEAELAALKAENQWRPVNEFPEMELENKFEVRGVASYWKTTHPLCDPWGRVKITHWRELPEQPEQPKEK